MLEMLENQPSKYEKIKTFDLKVPNDDETSLILLRNIKDNRSLEEGEYGALVPESVEQALEKFENNFDEMFESLSPEDREKLDFWVIGSDFKMMLPDGGVSEHRRGYETAEVVIEALKKSMEKNKVASDQLLNESASGGAPTEAPELKDLRAIDESPQYIDFLRKKYPGDVEFWDAYEGDVEKETREEMGAEGPDEIADRMKDYLTMATNLSNKFHSANPERKLMIIAASHYDSISPYLKRHVADMDKDVYLPIDNASGVTFQIDKESNAKTKIHGKEYETSLKYSSAIK